MRSLVFIGLGYIAATRAHDVWLTRRNTARLLARGGRLVRDDGVGLLVLVHVLWFFGIALEERVLGPTIASPIVRWACLGLFVLADVTRSWCKASLGERFSFRVVTLEGEPLVARGPYRFLRHPNYAAALVLVATLPPALGLVWTSALCVPLKLLALARRVRAEDAALGRR